MNQHSADEKRKRDESNDETNPSDKIAQSSSTGQPGNNPAYSTALADQQSSVPPVHEFDQSSSAAKQSNQFVIRNDTTERQFPRDDSTLFNRLEMAAGAVFLPNTTTNNMMTSQFPIASKGSPTDQNTKHEASSTDPDDTTFTNSNDDLFEPHRKFPNDSIQFAAVPVEHSRLQNYQQSGQTLSRLQYNQPLIISGASARQPTASLMQQMYDSSQEGSIPLQTQQQLMYNNDIANTAATADRSSLLQRNNVMQQDFTLPSYNVFPQLQQLATAGPLSSQLGADTKPTATNPHGNDLKVDDDAQRLFSGNVATASNYNSQLVATATDATASLPQDFGLRVATQLNYQYLQQSPTMEPSIESRQQQILDSMRQRQFDNVDMTTLPQSTNSIQQPTPGILLARPSEDSAELSQYQCMIRLHLEVFACTKMDTVRHKTQGRRRLLLVGQIGVRCKHCCFVPYSERGSGSAYFPSSLKNLYQAAQNMASTHLHSRCNFISNQDRQELIEAQQRTYSKGSKEYWIDCCVDMGIVEANISNDSNVVNSYLKFDHQ